MAEIEILLAKTSEQISVVEVVEVTVALNLSITPKVPITEPSLSVTAVQRLINLEEELVATNVEETEVVANLSVI